MVLVAVLQTLKGLAIAVVEIGEPAVRATPTRVLRVNLLDRDVVFLGFVLNAAVQAVERPSVSPHCASPLTNASQTLKRNHRTLVLAGFHNDFIPSGLREDAVEAVCLLSHVIIGFVVQRSPAGGDVLALERVVYDVLCRPEEGVYGVFEECGVVIVYVECDRDSTPQFDILCI